MNKPLVHIGIGIAIGVFVVPRLLAMRGRQ